MKFREERMIYLNNIQQIGIDGAEWSKKKERVIDQRERIAVPEMDLCV